MVICIRLSDVRLQETTTSVRDVTCLYDLKNVHYQLWRVEGKKVHWQKMWRIRRVFQTVVKYCLQYGCVESNDLTSKRPYDVASLCEVLTTNTVNKEGSTTGLGKYGNCDEWFTSSMRRPPRWPSCCIINGVVHTCVDVAQGSEDIFGCEHGVPWLGEPLKFTLRLVWVGCDKWWLKWSLFFRVVSKIYLMLRK